MVRRLFQRSAAKAPEAKAGKQHANGVPSTIFRRVAREDGVLVISPVSSDVTESTSVSAVTVLSTGSYTYDKPLLDSLTEIHDLKVELDQTEEALWAKDRIIAEQQDVLSHLLTQLNVMERRIMDATKSTLTMTKFEEEISRLRAELNATEQKLDATKSTLTMKQLELNARKQDVLDKDIALLLQTKKSNEDNPIDILVGLGLNIVGNLPFVQFK